MTSDFNDIIVSVVRGLMVTWLSDIHLRLELCVIVRGCRNQHVHPPAGMVYGLGALPPGSLFGMLVEHIFGYFQNPKWPAA